MKLIMDGNKELLEDYEVFFFYQKWLPIGDAEFDRALSLRGLHSIKTPDALHVATALNYSCEEFWTNDDRLCRAVPALAVNIFSQPA